MKTSAKWLSIVLTLCFIVSSIVATTTLAATAKPSVLEKDGVLVSISTSRDTYESIDKVDILLAVGNNSGTALTNVVSVISVPGIFSQSHTTDVIPAAGTTQYTVTPTTVPQETQVTTESAETTGSSEETTEPVETTGTAAETTEPVETTGAAEETTEPVETTGTAEETTEPVETTGTAEETTEPVETTGTAAETTEPVETTGTAEETTEPKENAPNTGDNSLLMAAIALMIGSAAGLIAMMATGKLKLDKSFMLLLLVCAMLASMAPVASAAEADAAVIEVAKDVTVGNETVTIAATVTYDDVASDVVTRADMEAAISEVAWDFYMKDVWIQYDSVDLNSRADGSNQPMSRWIGGHTRLDNYLNTLEDATAHDTMYSVCSFYPWAVYYEALDYPLFGNSLNASTFDVWCYAEAPDDMCIIRYHNWPEGSYENVANETGYVTHDKCVTYDEIREFLANWEQNLRPGDILYAVSGHVCIYVGNGWIIESQGRKYNLATGADTLEVGGSIKAWTVEDYFFNAESGSSYLLDRLQESGNKRICVIRPLNLLTVDDGDGNPDNDVLNAEYELDLDRLNMQFSNDPNNILKTSGYTVQNSALGRMEYPAMNINRTVNITQYGTAVKDGNITYTVSITNESNNADYVAYRSHGNDTAYAGEAYVSLPIAETIPANTELVSAPGATLVGNTLYWTIDVPVGETVDVTYTVKVTGEIGDEIVCGGGWVSSIPSNTITNKIGGEKISAEALANMAEFYAAGKNAWNSNDGYKISAGTTQGTRFAERIYNETVGIDLQLPEVQELVDMLFTQSLIEEENGMYLQYGNGKMSRYMYTLNDTTADSANQIYRDMVVDGYYGGIWVYTNTYAGNPRTDELRTDYLEPGDILLYLTLKNSASGGQASEVRNVTKWQVLVYMGNECFASLDSDGKLQELEKTLAVLPAFTYDMFVALRPSQAYADINTDVAAFVGPAPDLTEEDERQQYVPNVSDILLNERLSAKLAALTPDDGWNQGYFNFAGQVYGAIGIEAPVAGYWDPSYASWMKALFIDNVDGESDGCAIYQHEYYLVPEPSDATATMFESLIYYDGPTMMTKKPITSLDELHPGDVIMGGIRLDRHYAFLVYQGNGKFLCSINSLTGGAMGYHGWGEYYCTYTITSDEDLMAFLYGPTHVFGPEGVSEHNIGFEAYLVVRPSRVYEDINQVPREITESPLTDSEKAGLSSLSYEDWVAAGSPYNLNKVAPWAYNSIKVRVSDYLNKSIYSTRGILFSGTAGTAGTHEVRLANDSSFNLNLRIMLEDGYFGGTWFKTESKVFTAADFEIGDIFAGAKTVNGVTCYWTALYQGDGQFLVIENSNDGGIRCFADTSSIYSTTIGTEWDYYYVLRPQNLAELRDMALSPLTEAEKAKLEKIDANTCNTNNVGTDNNNIHGFAPWVYKQMGVDLSGRITKSCYNVFVALFNGEDLRTSGSNYTADLSAMLVDASWGGLRFSAANRHALTTELFEVGDIFSGRYTDSASKGHYWTAIYLGDSKFLCQDTNTKQVTNVTLDQINALMPTDSDAKDTTDAVQNKWCYYFVLRPDQLSVPVEKEETTDLRDITDGKLTDAEKQALAALAVMDWKNSSESSKNNLNGAGVWMYKTVGINVSGYFDKTVNSLNGILFPSMPNEAYGQNYYTLSAVTPENLKYHTMLVAQSWGGEYFAPNDQHTVAQADMQIGDVFCGRYADNGQNVYWVALYQGDGQFLVQESHNANGVDCFAKTYEEMYAVNWICYYILRPDNLVTGVRDISTGVLTPVEKYTLANMDPVSLNEKGIGDTYNNVNGFAPWVYKQMGVNISDRITTSSWNVYVAVFNGSNLRAPTSSKYDANLSNMNVENAWGGFRFDIAKRHALTTDTFEVGDIFTGKYTDENGNGHYWTAIYQGDENFLVQDSNTRNVSVVKLADIVSKIPDETVAPTTTVSAAVYGLWEFYLVLRPDQLV